MAYIITALMLFVASNAQICPKSNRICDKADECCSSHGWCGTTADYCTSTYDFGESGCPECICEGEATPESPPEVDSEPVPSDEVTPFERNCNCICYGDPHCKMWNCAVNNWQGPHHVDPLDVYYMTRCNGQTVNDMPFDVIGVNQRYDSYFSSLDYTILKLYDGAQQICIKNKGAQGVSYNNDCGDNYNIIPNQNEIIVLGSNFEIIWKLERGYSKLYLTVKNSVCEDYDLTIITQTATANEEAVEIQVSECYKPFTCGMCGDFYHTGLTFQTLAGDTIKLNPGCWGGTANDETGLTYLVSGDDGSMSTAAIPQRRILQETMDEPCHGLRSDIEKECNSQLKQYSSCCWDRKEFCEDIIISCGWDSCSCVMGKSHNLTQAQNQNTVDLCVTSVLNASMNFVCGLDAENFIVPDMSIYDHVIPQTGIFKCNECNAGASVLMGIVIGAFLFGIVGVLVYFCVIRPKLEMKKVGDNLATDAHKTNGAHETNINIAYKTNTRTGHETNAAHEI